MRIFPRFPAALLSLSLMLPASPAATQGLACAPRAQVIDRLAQNAQTRRAIGQAGQAVMELFAEDTRGRWTLTVSFRDGRMCLLASGVDFEARDEIFPAPGTAS